jgi:hypothetical protein
LLSCALAASTTAALTGALSGVGLYCLAGLSAHRPAHVHELSNAAVFTTGIAALVGTIVGTPAAALIICLSGARYAPWRALPFLVAGAALGIGVIGLPWSLFPLTENVAYLAVGMPIVGAILGGTIATRFAPSPPADRGRWPFAAVPGFALGLFAAAVALVFSLGAALSRFGAITSALAVPKSVLLLAFIVYLIGGSIAFAAVVRSIAWSTHAFSKGLATGIVAGAMVIAGFTLFAVPTPGS